MGYIASYGAMDEKNGGILPSFQSSLDNFEKALPFMNQSEFSQLEGSFGKFFFSPRNGEHSLASYLVKKGVVQQDNFQLTVPIHMMTNCLDLFNMFREENDDLSPFQVVEERVLKDFYDTHISCAWGESEDDY